MTTNSTEPGYPKGEQARILLVDDDASLKDMLASLLGRNGHTAVKSSDPSDALLRLEAGAFDIAMVDVMMPQIQGPDLIPFLLAEDSSLQIVMMTGNGTLDVAVRSLRAGAADFIEKPVRAESVLDAVNRAIARRRLDRMTALYRSSQTIFDAQNFDRLPEAIVSVAMQVMSADAASLLLPNLAGELCVAHAYGLDSTVQNVTRIQPGQGIAGRVALSGKPVIINGSAAEHAEFSDVVPRRRVKSSIVYPLVSGSRLVGMLTFNRLTDDRAFRQPDLEQASVLASQVMLALENLRLSRQTVVSEKLAAVGQLAAGIAHEINTPVQFVGDGLHFLDESLDALMTLVSKYEDVVRTCKEKLDEPELFAEVDALSVDIDIEDLRAEVPKAIARTKDGIARVTSIVRSIKSFGRPDAVAKEPTDLVRLVEATLTVARGEYKYVADVETHFGDLPLISAHPGEISQVVLNLVVNAAHAVADKAKAEQSPARGKITIVAGVEGEQVVLTIADTGCGIPLENRKRIFDPFFTTKAVGRGTGLGLSIARGIVVDKHGGELVVESEPGRGSKFIVRLPAGVRSDGAE